MWYFAFSKRSLYLMCTDVHSLVLVGYYYYSLPRFLILIVRHTCMSRPVCVLEMCTTYHPSALFATFCLHCNLLKFPFLGFDPAWRFPLGRFGLSCAARAAQIAFDE